MKKLFTLFLITALALSCFTGCGDNKPADKETTSETEMQQTTETTTETK